MNKYLHLFLLSCITISFCGWSFKTYAQYPGLNYCNSVSQSLANVVIYSSSYSCGCNAAASNMTINIDQHIPNLKIAVFNGNNKVNVTLAGTYVNDVVAVMIAGENGGGTITGLPVTATSFTSIDWGITFWLIGNKGSQFFRGGPVACDSLSGAALNNSADQTVNYFLTCFGGATTNQLLFHKAVYNSNYLNGTYNISTGGNCCEGAYNPTKPRLTGVTLSSSHVCEGSSVKVTLLGVLANENFTVHYTIGGGAVQTATMNTTSTSLGGGIDGVKNNTFTISNITSGNNGQYLIITDMIRTGINQSNFSNPPNSPNDSVGIFGTEQAFFTKNDSAILQVDAKPVVSTPTIITGSCGSADTVSVVTTAGTQPFTYKWEEGSAFISDGVDFSGTGTNKLVILFPANKVGKTYKVMVTSGVCASVVSSPSPPIPASNAPIIIITPSFATVCPGMSTTLTASGGNSYNWAPSTGLSITSGATVTANPSITTTYVVTGTSSCGTTTANVVISVTSGTSVPSVTISATPDSTICSFATITFSASTTNGGTAPSFQWKRNSSIVGSNSSTYTTTGLANNDTITCIMTSNANCVSPLTVTSNSFLTSVNPTVNPSVSISVNPSGAICAGTPVNFSAVPVNGGNSPSYQWKVNGTPAGSGPTFSSSALSNFDIVTCDMTSNAACISGSPIVPANSISISVLAKANAGNITALRDTICEGTPMNLTVTGNSGTPQWQSSITSNSNFTNTGFTGTNYITTVSQTSWFRVYTGTGNCADTSGIVKIVVNPAPVAGFASSQAGLQVTFTDSSIGDTRYYWDFGDSTTSNEKNPVHAYAHPASFYVCLTVYNGSNCSFTFCKHLDVATGITTISPLNNTWKIYPNPFGEDLFIEKGDNVIKNIEVIELYDLLGRLRFDRDFSGVQHYPLQVDLSELTNGMYYLKIKTVNTNYIQSIIKQ